MVQRTGRGRNPWAPPSQLDLRAQLHDAVDRDVEEVHRPRRASRHGDEQPLAPARHAGARGRDQGFSAEEEGRLHQLELQAVRPAQRQRGLPLPEYFLSNNL